MEVPKYGWGPGDVFPDEAESNDFGRLVRDLMVACVAYGELFAAWMDGCEISDEAMIKAATNAQLARAAVLATSHATTT
jgi:hypothetical protein